MYSVFPKNICTSNRTSSSEWYIIINVNEYELKVAHRHCLSLCNGRKHCPSWHCICCVTNLYHSSRLVDMAGFSKGRSRGTARSTTCTMAIPAIHQTAKKTHYHTPSHQRAPQVQAGGRRRLGRGLRQRRGRALDADSGSDDDGGWQRDGEDQQDVPAQPLGTKEAKRKV